MANELLEAPAVNGQKCQEIDVVVGDNADLYVAFLHRPHFCEEENLLVVHAPGGNHLLKVAVRADSYRYRKLFITSVDDMNVTTNADGTHMSSKTRWKARGFVDEGENKGSAFELEFNTLEKKGKLRILPHEDLPINAE